MRPNPSPESIRSGAFSCAHADPHRGGQRCSSRSAPTPPTGTTATRPTPSLIRRLNEKVVIDGDCWVWTGALNGKGYGGIGKTTAPGRVVMLRVHRLAYVNEHGPIPRNVLVDHRCRNKLCARPSHLRAATNKQNQEHRGGANANGTSGYRGVTRRAGSNRWMAQIRHDRKLHYLGYYDTAEAASEAVEAARVRLFTHHTTAA